ncbi:MAG: transcription termination/antitermination protein NusA [Clostridia bacterium]|nr:transcription termination/antitermination protein NusA [Clostridia bacterium]
MKNKDFFQAIDDLNTEKGIKKDLLLETLKNALVIAYKKHTGDSRDVVLDMSPEKETVKFFAVKTVVEEVTDPEKEISLENAQLIKASAKVGDEFKDEFTPKDFGRIAAQTAKQVLLQKLRETERDNTLAEFEDKENEIKMCTIRRVEDKNVYVEIGAGDVEALMLPKDQTPGETYNVNDKLMVYVKKVRNAGKNAQILVSRTSPGLVKKLFENVVPEIAQGIVTVKAISREAGQRTKIAIMSNDANVDALGACVGNKGSRVNEVVKELGGEKIDIILWSEDPLEFIAKALSPAKVLKVSAIEGEKIAKVVVPDDKLSLAIGKDGQNARLAARLTGWKIDVKSESKARREEEANAATEETAGNSAFETELEAEEEEKVTE